MTDETISFDVADDNLRAAASSCDANDVDLHHPLHPLVNAWEYIVGSTMYGKWDGTRGVGRAGEASTRTTTKTKTAVAAPVYAPRRQRTAEGVRAIGRTARGAWCIVADESHCIVRCLVSGDHEDGRRGDATQMLTMTMNLTTSTWIVLGRRTDTRPRPRRGRDSDMGPRMRTTEH